MLLFNESDPYTSAPRRDHLKRNLSYCNVCLCNFTSSTYALTAFSLKNNKLKVNKNMNNSISHM